MTVLFSKNFSLDMHQQLSNVGDDITCCPNMRAVLLVDGMSSLGNVYKILL